MHDPSAFKAHFDTTTFLSETVAIVLGAVLTGRVRCHTLPLPTQTPNADLHIYRYLMHGQVRP